MPDQKYNDLDKDALIAEIKKRRSNGSSIAVDLRASEDVLRNALLLDDVAAGDSASPAPFTGGLANQLPLQPEMPSHATQPSEEAFGSSVLHKNSADGYVYQVIKSDDTDALRPYKARVPPQASGHPGLFWEGSEDEFKAVFDRI